MNDPKHCFGCVKLTNTHRSPTEIKRSCVYLIANPNGDCPCTVCIVKMMCKANCSPLRSYYKLYY